MQLAPATLSTITAILSAQGISATGAQLSALLAPLTGETPPKTETGLREGEFYLLVEVDSSDREQCHSLDALMNSLETYVDQSLESWYNRDINDMVEVFVVRRQIDLRIKSKAVVE